MYMEVISKEKIKQIFLEDGVGKIYAEQAVNVFDCISLQLSGKKLGKDVILVALSLQNAERINLKGFNAWSNIYSVFPYTDSLIVENVQQRYNKSQIWLLEKKKI